MSNQATAIATAPRASSYRAFESNLRQTFAKICKHACDMIKVDHSGFVRFDKSRETGAVVAQYPDLAGLMGRVVKLRGVPAEEEFLASSEPLVIDDVTTADELGEVRNLLLEFDIRSICIVMVFVKGIPVGSFSFDSIGRRRDFTAHDVDLCRSFSLLAETMIDNARLVDWFEAFERATVAITSESAPERLLQEIATQANVLFGAQSAGLYQRECDENGYETLRLAASTQHDLTGHSLSKGDGMAWQLINGDESFLTSSDYRLYGKKDPKLESRFGSVLEVPLLKQTDRIGVIFLSDEVGRVFTKEDAAFLQRFADMSTLALQHGSLLKRMEQLSSVAAEISGYVSSATLDDKLTDIAHHAAAILNAEMCGVWTRLEPSVLLLKASYGHASGAFAVNSQFSLRDKPGSGLTGAIGARLIAEYEKTGSAVFNSSGTAVRNDPAIAGGSYPGPKGICHSILAVPLVSRGGHGHGGVVGMLRACNKKGPNGMPSDSARFTDEDEWILRIFAEAVVIAIDSATLIDQLNIQRTLLDRAREGVHRVALDLALGDRGHALQNLVEGIRRATDSDIVTLYRTKPSDGQVIGPATTSGLRVPEDTVRPSQDSAVGRVLETNDFHVTEDAQHDSVVGGTFVQREGVRASIGTPIWIKQREDGQEKKLTFGVLFVNYRTPHKFSIDDIEIVKMFSHLAAVAIQNQDLFEHERRKALTQQALREAAAALAEVSDVSATAAHIAREAYKVAHACDVYAAITAVGVIHDGDYETVVTYPDDETRGSIARLRYVMALTNDGKSGGVVADAFASGRARSVTTDLLESATNAPALSDDARAQIAIPIGDGKNTVGIIYLESHAALPFDDTAEEVFDLFAPLAFDSLRAARQHEDLETARLREVSLTEIALFHIKSGVIVHRHRGVVRDFVKWSKMLMKDAEKEQLSPRIREDLQWVTACAKALDDLLMPTSADVGALSTVSLNSVLREWETRLNDNQAFANVGKIFDLQATADCMVRIDSDLMREVFSIFATNALNAMLSTPTKRLVISTSVEDAAKCRIAIADTGVGMDAETLERVRKGVSSSSVSRAGTGVGLRTAQLILKNFGGEVMDPVTGPDGTAFTIVLPATIDGDVRKD